MNENAQLASLQKVLVEREKQVSQLSEKLEVSTSSTTQFRRLLASRDTQVQVQEKTIATLEARIAAMMKAQQATSDELQLLLAQTQERNTALQRENDLLTSKMNSSYTADDLAKYFNEAIDTFNGSMNNSAENVSYIINSMDVDLKAQVVKSNGELRFLCDPAASGQEVMSTIKISIRAVPK